MPKYAQQTEVTSDRSRSEIERTLQRYGASKFAYGWSEGYAVVQFEMRDRRIKFKLPLPDENDPDIITTPAGRARSNQQAIHVYEQAKRQRWRALLLSIKAKLESVEAGIEEFEEAFLAQIILPDGRTVSEMTRPGIELAYTTGQMPHFPLLEGPRVKP